VLVVLTALVAGCAAGRAFRRGGSAARAGDWDNAVEHYRAAVQADPQSAEYKIALERAMISASLVHLDQARVLEARDQLDEALREYRRASEFDPPNRMIGGKVAELERRIRDQLEAARPKPSIQQLRETARQVGPPPLYNLTTVMEPLKFNQTNLRDILNSIGASTGINVTYESTFQDRPYTITLEGVTLEEALQQILSANTLFYKVVNQRTILVIPDNQAKRQQFEEQVLRTFYISHADPMEIQTMLNQIIRVPGQQVPPVVSASKTSNTLTIRATKSVADIIEQLVQQADKPRAEVIIDVQILEVNRTRTKQFGLDLGDYAISTVFSPESDPRGAAAPAAATGQTGTTGAARPPVFNANTISRGINTTDFYLSVPSAVVRFLESDSETKVIAKPQLRGAENVALKLNLGEEIPIPTTTFSPLAQGGPNFQPLTSFGYRSVGVNVEMTPRVTYEGDVILDPLFVESSTLGSGIVIAGQELPSFGSRKVTTALRLREGESSLLAGLLREDQRKAAAGFPGLLGIPIIRQLFSSNDQNIQQTDIVMLLTPRIVRTHELTAQDVSPIYIGTQSNLGLSGPPPLIAPVSTPPAATPGAPVTPTAAPPAAPPAGPPAKPDAGPSTAAPGTKGVPAAPAATPRETGQVVVTPPRTDFQVGGGPYIVPISITGVSQLSRVALTVSYNPATLRVRTLQEGSFMRTGSVPAVFTSQPDAAGGRLDIAIVRTGDATGVAGTGLLAAVLFDAIGAGPANITVTGTAASPAGSAVPLQFAAVPPVTVK
jgi:type II secretory pathway component GspD/PulD (secretin)